MELNMERVRNWDDAKSYVERIVEKRGDEPTFDERVAVGALFAEKDIRGCEIVESQHFDNALRYLCEYAKNHIDEDKERAIKFLLMSLEDCQHYAIEELFEETATDYRDGRSNPFSRDLDSFQRVSAIQDMFKRVA